jgi:hypothetical protein
MFSGMEETPGVGRTIGFQLELLALSILIRNLHLIRSIFPSMLHPPLFWSRDLP